MSCFTLYLCVEALNSPASPCMSHSLQSTFTGDMAFDLSYIKAGGRVEKLTSGLGEMQYVPELFLIDG